jgi:murein DD-endopeptidase MepM/ murein hydrolase activator NlpD
VSRGAARLAALGALLAGLSGCAAPRPYRPLSTVFADAHIHDELDLSGVTHVVRRGETLYRIARTYGIDLADLMETNGIADPRELTVGQELFVPGADKVLEVPLAPAPIPTARLQPAPAAPPATAAPAIPPRVPEKVAAEEERRPPVPRAREVERDTPPAREPEPEARTAPIGRPPSAFAWPLKGVLYGRFGVRNGRRHDGIDLAAPEGTRVGAAAAGEAIYVGEQSGYGRIVILRHPGGLVSLYAHMRRALVEEGARVERGDPIGEVGQTGRTSGPHLHFEVRDGTRPRNPLLYLK